MSRSIVVSLRYTGKSKSLASIGISQPDTQGFSRCCCCCCCRRRRRRRRRRHHTGTFYHLISRHRRQAPSDGALRDFNMKETVNSAKRVASRYDEARVTVKGWLDASPILAGFLDTLLAMGFRNIHAFLLTF